MVGLEELYAYKAKYEKEKLFAEAKIAVVEEMIETEELAQKAKEAEVVAPATIFAAEVEENV